VYQVAVENAFNFSSPEYAALYESSAATAFQHPIWLSNLYGRLLAHNNAAPLVVVVRRTSDQSLAMVLPLVKRRYGLLKVVEFADLRVSDYAAVVADRRNFLAILDEGSLQRRLRHLLAPYDVLRIGKLGDDALRMNRLFGILEPRRMPTNAYAVPLLASFDDWRAQYLNRSYAKELGKKMRQLERKGQVRFEQVTADEQLRETFEAMRVFRRDRFEVNGGGELLQVPAYFDFYLGVAARPELARTYRLTLEGETIASALEPFRQVASPFARNAEGTGLGLSLVKALMESHGGTLELDSTLDVGTTARLIFPASRVMQHALLAAV